MKPKVRVRRARLADADGIVALEQHFPSDRMSLRSVRNFLRSPRAAVWIAADVSPHASAALILLTRQHGRSARIYSLVVAPLARGAGLGAQLVSLAERWAQRQGYRAITLEVRADNAAARALYARRGYALQRRLPAYYDDGADGLKLARALRATL